MTKRLLAFLLALTMVFSVLPTGYALDDGTAEPAVEDRTTVPAADGAEPGEDGADVPTSEDKAAAPAGAVRSVQSGDCGEALTWTFDDETGVLTIEGSGAMTEYDYDSNKAPWLSYAAAITSLSLPEGLTTISPYAFACCSALTAVTIPETVTSIGRSAFNSTGLTTLHLPASVEAFGLLVTCNCASFTAFTVAEESQSFQAVDGVLYSKDGTTLISWPYAKAGSLAIPETVTAIAASAFTGALNLTSVTVPAAVVSVGNEAFYDSSLTSIQFADAAAPVQFGQSVFQQCASLTAARLPEGLTAIPDYAFYGCGSLNAIRLPDSVLTVGNYVFYDCTQLSSVHLGEGLTNIGGYMFANNRSLVLVVIPASVTQVGEYAFAGFDGTMKLTALVFNGSKPSAPSGNYVLYNCPSVLRVYYYDTYASSWSSSWQGKTTVKLSSSNACGSDLTWALDYDTGTLTISGTGAMTDYSSSGSQPWKPFASLIKTVVLPEGITTVGKYAFQNHTALETVVIPETAALTTVQNYAFTGCSKLTAISFPEGFTTVNRNAFQNCSALASVGFPSTLTTVQQYAFQNCSALAAMDLSSAVGLTSLGNYAFDGCVGPETLDLSAAASLGTLGSCAFQNCTGIAALILPDQMTAIGGTAFKGCGNLASVHLPASLKTIDASAFQDCAALEQVDLAGLQSLTTVGNYAFMGCSSLVSMEYPSGITAVNAGVFQDCAALQSVVLPAGVTKIDSYAFKNCSALTGFALPDNVTYINTSAFENCTALESVTWGSGSKLEQIGDYAFRNCGSLSAYPMPPRLKTIYAFAFSGCVSGPSAVEIPASVTGVGRAPFYGCTNLTAITANEANTRYASDGIAVFSKDMTTLYVYPGGREGAYTVPAGVTAIEDDCFNGCAGLTEISLPAGLTLIDIYAFAECAGLETVTIPSSVTSLQNYAFSGCSNLHWVYFKGAKPTINDPASCFQNCAADFVIKVKEHYLTSFNSNGSLSWYGYTLEVVDAGMQSCGDELYWSLDADTGVLTITGSGNMFDYTKTDSGKAPWLSDPAVIQAVVFPEGITSVGSYAFYLCENLQIVTIPEGVTSIGKFAFYGSGLQGTVALPASLTAVGEAAFTGCAGLTAFSVAEEGGLLSQDGVLYTADGQTLVAYPGGKSDARFTVPAVVQTVAAYAFARNALLTELTIPSSVKYINAYAFNNCTALTLVTVEGTLTKIDNYAFTVVSSLMEAVFLANPPGTVGTNIFTGYAEGFCIYANPKNASYWGGTSATSWKGYPLKYRISGTCGENLRFVAMDGVLTVSLIDETLPGVMTNFDNGIDVPWYSISLTSAVLPEGLTNLGSNAFRAQRNLAAVTLPQSLTSIGNYVFYGCSGLTGLEIPASVSSIGYDCFESCTSLGSIALPEGLDKIEWSSFYGCTSLSSVTIPSTVTSIGQNAFYGCTQLSSLELPAGLTALGGSCFYNCASLGSMEIPAGVQTIEQYCFQGCASLSEITLPDGIWTIGISAFRGCSSLTEISLPSALRYLDSYAFYGCSGLSSVVLPEGLEWVRSYTFYNCGLSSVTIPSTVTELGDYAFAYNNFSTVTIPAAVESIGASCFRYNYNLEEILFQGAPPTCSNYTFHNCSDYLTLFYLPEHAEDWAPNGETEWFYSTYSASFSYPIQEWCEPVVGSCGEDMSWRYYPNSGVLIVIGDGPMPNFDNADTKAPWSDYRETITQVRFRGQPTHVGSYAFYGCTALKKTTIPDSVETVGAYAFGGCTALSDLSLGTGLTAIGQAAFSGCAALESLALPDGLTSIGASAFAGCTTLTELTIPASVEEIGDSAFAGCSGLAAVSFEADPPAVFGETVFSGCFVDFTIYYPEEYASLWDEDGDGFWNGWPVWLFGTPKPFGHCGDNVEWSYEDGVLSIFGEGPTWDYGDPGALNSPPWADTFEVSQLQIYPGVTYLGTCFFAFCGGEGELTIPGTVQAIGYRAFYSDTFSSVVLGEGVKAIGPFAFAWGSNDGGYDGERFAYYHQDSMLSVTLPSTLEYIGTGAFSQCFWLSSPIVIPAGVEEIEPMTFYDCQRIPSITLSEGVTTIGYHAFYDCAALTELTIPASVSSIDATAFHWCFSLAEFHVDAANSAYQAVDGVLFTKDGKTLVRYPNGKGSSYSIPAGTEKIGADAFAETREYYFNIDFMDIVPDCFDDHTAIFLDSVSFPSSVTRIEDRAFFDSSITSVALNEGLTRIGKEAFSWSLLRTVEFPASLNYIDDYAFGYCRLLHSIYLHSDTGLGENVFYDCDGDFCALMGYPSAGKGARSEGLTWNGYPALYWPAGDPVYPWHVGPKVFAFIDEENTLILTGEGDMNNYSFPSGGGAPVRKSGSRDGDEPELLWGEDAARIEAICVREGVAYIGANTCCLLPNLTEVTLPTTMLALGDNAFRQCENLNRVVFEGPLPEYCGYDVFTDCAAELCLWYHVWNADTWAPEGETEWNGWPIRQIEMSDGYYLIGPKGWTLNDLGLEDCFAANPDAEGEYLLSANLNVGDSVKVVRVENGAISAWYLEGEGNEYVTDAAHAGEVTIYFRPAGNEDWSAFGGYIRIVPVEQPHVHSLVHVPAEAPGCETEGSVEYWYCADESCELYGRFFADEALTQELETVTIPALGHDFVDGTCTRCGAADPDYHPIRFTDVAQGAYYYEPVLWAVENRVTAGTSDTTFSPNQACTRAQIVTFLWRAAGSPEPTMAALPFTDVIQTAYYYDAVRWAVENGITSGVSGSSFCPGRTCTRAEAVTFLWRAAGSPPPTQTDMPFSDVPANTWYTAAVLWAVENNITVGSSETTFSPNQRCTRAQIVTFLYRATEP